MVWVNKLLSQNEQDEILAAFLQSQERDLYIHQINLVRFDIMLATIPTGAWRDRLTILRDTTVERVAEIESTLDATKGQLPSDERLAAAKVRLAAVSAIP